MCEISTFPPQYVQVVFIQRLVQNDQTDPQRAWRGRQEEKGKSMNHNNNQAETQTTDGA